MAVSLTILGYVCMFGVYHVHVGGCTVYHVYVGACTMYMHFNIVYYVQRSMLIGAHQQAAEK